MAQHSRRGAIFVVRGQNEILDAGELDQVIQRMHWKIEVRDACRIDERRDVRN